MAAFYRSFVDFELERLTLTNVRTTGKEIGRGSYGRVFEVQVCGTSCAAKEVHSHLIHNVSDWDFEAVKQTFLTECINSSRIHHPNVVQVLGIYYTRHAKLPWLVMELMDASLKSFLKKYVRDKVPHHFKLSILVDIAQGLEFLHGQDIVHRDLSSNNVLLTKHLVAKIADLGVAKVIEHNKTNTQTQTPGTLHFMPPEALLNKPRYGKPVDVFSLACIALHVITHKWPQPKERVQEDPFTYVMTALTEVQRREDYIKLCSSPPLKRLVESCLLNQPGRRPVISSVCADLKSLKANEEKLVPFAAANSVEQFDALQQSQSEVKELQNRINFLEQELLKKSEKMKNKLQSKTSVQKIGCEDGNDDETEGKKELEHDGADSDVAVSTQTILSHLPHVTASADHMSMEDRFTKSVGISNVATNQTNKSTKTVKGIFDSLSDDDDFFFPSVPRCTAAVKNQLPGADKKALSAAVLDTGNKDSSEDGIFVTSGDDGLLKLQPQIASNRIPVTTTAVKPKCLPTPLFDDDDDELDWLL